MRQRPWDGAGFRAEIEAALQDFVGTRRPAGSTPLGPDAERLVEHARISVSGGKRFRAAFCWWGHRAVAAADRRGGPAAGLRRRWSCCTRARWSTTTTWTPPTYAGAGPATHRAFEQLHRDQRLGRRAPEQYGASAAILLGDLLLSWSDELLRTCGLPADRVLEALGYFDLTRSEVVTGQFLDVSAQARGAADVDTAMTVLRYKSAKYSIERPLHIGAALAGGQPGDDRPSSAGSGCRSARPSSCATTCSASSATRR